MWIKLCGTIKNIERTRRLPDDEQNTLLLGKVTPSSSKSRSEYLCRVLSGILLVSCTLNIYLWLARNERSQLHEVCSGFTSQYRSPVQEDVKIRYKSILFNGSFSKETAFRQPAGPAVDEAWQSLGTDYLPVIVPESAQAEKYGLLPGYVKRRKDQGGGFFANVEVLHHLHCLNLLRKASYFSYDYYSKEGKGAFKNSPEVVRIHFGHCLDILRQQIMCTADFGVFGQLWIEDPPGPFVDFNTQHKCKNFEAIRHWAEQNQIVEAENDRVELRPGDTVLSEIP